MANTFTRVTYAVFSTKDHRCIKCQNELKIAKYIKLNLCLFESRINCIIQWFHRRSYIHVLWLFHACKHKSFVQNWKGSEKPERNWKKNNSHNSSYQIQYQIISTLRTSAHNTVLDFRDFCNDITRIHLSIKRATLSLSSPTNDPLWWSKDALVKTSKCAPSALFWIRRRQRRAIIPSLYIISLSRFVMSSDSFKMIRYFSR